MKKEADGILSEVRRKLSECSQITQLLNAVEKLRNLRKESARKRGLDFIFYVNMGCRLHPGIPTNNQLLTS